MRRLGLVLAVLALGSEARGGESLIVHLADGTSFPLRSWSLSYEYSAWRRGQSPAFATTTRKEAREILTGKRILPVAGLTAEIEYRTEERIQEVGAETQKVKVAVAIDLVLRGPDGKKTVLKPDPPHPDLLVSSQEGTIVQARALDLQGETLTGTKRDFCLFSYSALLQCSTEPDQQVVKIEFQP